jgi:hypothetical protein
MHVGGFKGGQEVEGRGSPTTELRENVKHPLNTNGSAPHVAITWRGGTGYRCPRSEAYKASPVGGAATRQCAWVLNFNLIILIDHDGTVNTAGGVIARHDRYGQVRGGQRPDDALSRAPPVCSPRRSRCLSPSALSPGDIPLVHSLDTAATRARWSRTGPQTTRGELV